MFLIKIESALLKIGSKSSNLIKNVYMIGFQTDVLSKKTLLVFQTDVSSNLNSICSLKFS